MSAEINKQLSIGNAETERQRITRNTYMAAVATVTVGGLLLWVLGEKSAAATWLVGGSVGGFFGVQAATLTMMYAPHGLEGWYRTLPHFYGALVAFFLGGAAISNFDVGVLPVVAVALAGPASASTVIAIFNHASEKLQPVLRILYEKQEEKYGH